jgi:superfamily II DNA or RNA helicase
MAMRITLNAESLDDYRTFLAIKRLPHYRFEGRTAIIADEYADRIGCKASVPSSIEYTPHELLFDYQRDITRMALTKRKFSIFADCGLGKTLMFLDYIKHVEPTLPKGRCVLIVSPLMVVTQTLAEAERFYGDKLKIEQVRAANLGTWLRDGSAGRIGITNYEALTDDLERGRLGCLILDESSMLKSHYGKWGTKCLDLGRGLDWKMACTGTPAPNDRIEYANHAVFMDAFPTVNSFLARFFVNRGQCNNRWELKRHARHPFYRALSHWAIFLTNPSVYGWKDQTESLPPIEVHMHHVGLTSDQQAIAYERTGRLFVDQIGGITNRSVLSQIAKGNFRGRQISTNKPGFIRNLLASWPDESTIVWCLYNAEQERLAKELDGSESISGVMPYEHRERIISDFKAGRFKTLITKPKILGFGLNLQVATRQVFSGLQDSYESYYQAVKRSNRYGATKPLNVHIPFTDIEHPMIETVLRKASDIQQDTEEQERIFRAATLER